MKVSLLRKASSAFAPWCLLLLLLPRRASSTHTAVSGSCTTVLLGVTLGPTGKLTADELDAFEVAWMDKFNDIWEFLPYNYQVTGITLVSETVTPVRRRLDSGVADIDEERNNEEEEEEDGGIASRHLQSSQNDNSVQTNNDGTCSGCPPGDLPDDDLRRMLRSHGNGDGNAEREMYLLYVAQPSSNYGGWAQLAGDLTNALKLTNETAFDTLEEVRIHCDSMTNEFRYKDDTGTTTQVVYAR